MSSQTVTAKGQITLKRELLNHLGVKPGERLAFDKLPGGALRVRAARPAGGVEAFVGLALLEAGGDFAGGVIAYEGARLGGEVFASFDAKAVRLLAQQGVKTRQLG
ncbi:MAG: hypothetical protein AMXMBFR78_31830 [Rubrivivax sp.]|jgi:hypothetical protein